MEKRILLLTTGGTIASTQTERGLAPGLGAQELLESLRDILPPCRIDTREVCSLDSTNMTWREWLLLAGAVREAYDAYDGFVITHGTDTMAYTASALSYLIQKSPKPIVLTGAQKPIHMEITDAKSNLRDAVLYALDEKSAGVQILFNGQVITGTRAKKVRSFSFDAFSSINYPPLAAVQDGRILRYIDVGESREEPVFYDSLNPRVFLLKLTPGIRTEILEAVFQTYDCIIVESFGVGGIPDSMADDLFAILSRYEPGEKVLVMTTQVTYEGSNVGVYEVGQRLRERFPLLEARDMTLEAVLAKMMWILGQNLTGFGEIEKLFYERIGQDTILA
ncbi:MAG: asparaginase [Lachnospiraceae bacterium]|jgi:L-asparaginase|nr:asparaginase [Lachnospiraceae bacterium]